MIYMYMHVHACIDNGSVRTTIEMKPEHRARILELAANRGEKGFSTVVADALELYLEAQSRGPGTRDRGNERLFRAGWFFTCLRVPQKLHATKKSRPQGDLPPAPGPRSFLPPF